MKDHTIINPYIEKLLLPVKNVLLEQTENYQ